MEVRPRSAGQNIAEKTAITFTWLNNIVSDTNDDTVINIEPTEVVPCMG